jgi:hypothetical protein
MHIHRLVLYLKDINLPRPDMYDTCQLIAFLQQIITFDGFYNEELEFLKLERIQIVASINAATTVGRYYIHIYICIHIYIYINRYIYIYIHIYMYTYINMNICPCICINMSLSTYL